MIYLISFIFIVIGAYLLCREWNRTWMPDIEDIHPDAQQACSCVDEIDQCIHCQERKYGV
jgi:hypothetical protein